MKHTTLNIIASVVVVITAMFAIYIWGQQKMNLTSGIDTTNMDTRIRAGDDFYNYANGGWREKNPLPDDYSRYSSFDYLRKNNDDKMHDLVMNVAAQENVHGTNEQKIGTFYNVAMNDKKLNADGIKPVAADLSEIDAITSAKDLPAYLGRTQKYSGAFWAYGPGPDAMDSETFIFGMGQGGIGLPDRDYYFDDASADIREKYKKYLSDLFAHFGINADANAVYEMEKELATAHSAKELLRDAAANYHKYSYADFIKEFSGFDWDAYFNAMNIKPKYIDVMQPNAIHAAIKIINNADIETIKNYLRRSIIGSAAPFLDDATYELNFDFYSRTMTGQKTPRPRWRRVLAVMDNGMGEALGKLFVQKYFPAAAKVRMEKMVASLRDAYAERIHAATWMSDTTKVAALKKLSSFHAKIGYPDKFRDYSKLQIMDDSYWANIKRINDFNDAFWNAKIDAPTDHSIWLMTPQTVNAYYEPQSNEICFPAGILQPPFFDMTADDAFNFGAIGSVIGHEMTHGFDDQGRHFDAAGNLRDWWTDADANAFNARADVLRQFFNNIIVAPNVHANGEFTLGENLADMGGVTIAWTAFTMFGDKNLKSENGLSPAQRFFIAYAGTEAGHIRPAEILRLTKVDVHSLSPLRVNAILPQIDAWYDAFNITPNDKLYIAPDARARVW